MTPKRLALKVLSVIVAVVIAAAALVIFVLVLASLWLLCQRVADATGYQLKISDEIAKTVIAVGGAFGVAFVALYGVHHQTVSAERRHKVDSGLALRKEIFLEAAEAAAVQHQVLLSFANPEITDTDRGKMAQEISKAFSKVQMVGSEETIGAMLHANEEWTRALIDIQLLGPVPQGVERLNRLSEIQERATPFMRALWRFNLVARKEIESSFEDDNRYLSTMDGTYARLRTSFDEIGRRIASM